MVYSLLSMLGTHDPEDMSQTLLAMSSSADSCVAMRQSGCLPLLVQVTATHHCLYVPSDLLYSGCNIFWECRTSAAVSVAHNPRLVAVVVSGCLKF